MDDLELTGVNQIDLRESYPEFFGLFRSQVAQFHQNMFIVCAVASTASEDFMSMAREQAIAVAQIFKRLRLWSERSELNAYAAVRAVDLPKVIRFRRRLVFSIVHVVSDALSKELQEASREEPLNIKALKTKPYMVGLMLGRGDSIANLFSALRVQKEDSQ